MSERFLVTAALPYANGPVHIGHLAGCYLPADIYVRYLKAKKKDVVFICGSDEHGMAITIKARNEGVSPKEIVDKYHNLMKNTFQEFGIEFSHYGRTSAPIHHQTSADFFKYLYEKGIFQEIETEQYFDEKANSFLADRYIIGTCPKCGNERAYGDQCERCGTSLSPQDLIHPHSALSGEKPILKKTKHWFLPMDHIQNSPEFKEYIPRLDQWKSNIKGQVNSWLNEGLKPRSMTRDLDWGVKVPIPGAENKVLYVWFDAPIGYISATREYFESIGLPNEWEKYWKSDESKLVHFIGKDNIVFHALIFPMILMEHGSYVLPWNVPANEFLNLEGDKISTSRNWAVWLHEYLNDFPGKQDELRYVLTSIAPETKDSDFSWKDFQTRVNSELVAILGNFVNRVVVLTHKYYQGFVPKILLTNSELSNQYAELFNNTLRDINGHFSEMQKLLSEFKFRDAQQEMMNICRLGNKFLAETEPWKLVKENPDYTQTILRQSLVICHCIAIASQVFLPNTSNSIIELLNLKKEDLNYDNFANDIFDEGHKINEAKHLFKNIEDSEIQLQLDKLEKSKQNQINSSKEQNSIPESYPEIVYDDFAKIDIRVGTIEAAERVPKTDKLLKLSINIGLETRTIVSGIAHCFEPENIIGQRVSVLINLAPRKLKGIESQGMILMADSGDGKLSFVCPPNEVPNGSRIA